MSHLRLVARSLAGRPGRNVLTALGIAIGIAAFVALVSLAESFQRTMDAMFASRRTDVSVVRRDSPDVLMSSLPEAMWPELARVSGVAAAAPVLAQMLWAEGLPAALVLGVASGTYLLDHFEILQGRSLRPEDEDSAILGHTLARRLGKAPGDDYEIESWSFRVVGVYDAGNSLENSGAVVPLRRLQWLRGREDEITAVNLRVEAEADPEEVARRITARYHMAQAVPTSETVQANEAFALARAMSWGTSLVALCIGLIGTLNSMLMSVLERTREMGLLRALGWRRRRLCALLLGESLVLGLAGGIAGVALGAALLEALLRYPRIDGILTAGLSASIAGTAVLIALGLGLLGGLLPALRGSALSPTVALHHD
jgi:putative ABC transport system permease protein